MSKFELNEVIMLIPEFDVFLSYAPEDSEVAQRLASTMEESGIQVWWQHHHLKPKESIALLQRQMNDNRVIMVLWSKNSAGSGRVQAEARVGAHRGRLIATRIGQILPPRDTAAVLYADLSDWIGGKEHGAIRKMFTVIWKLIGKGEKVAPPPPPIPTGGEPPSMPVLKKETVNTGAMTPEAQSSETSNPVHSPVDGPETGSDSEAHSEAPSVEPINAPAPHHSPSPEELEEEMWQSAYENNSRSGYKDYLKQYPEGTFAEEARGKIAQKKSSNRLIIWALVGFLVLYLLAVLIMGILSIE